jgi:hypothetical protein
MNYAPTYIANLVSVLSLVLTFLGVHVGNDALQTTVVTVLAIAVPLFTMFRQWYTGRSTLAGRRPKPSYAA